MFWHYGWNGIAVGKMKYDKELGIYHFNGDEEDIAFHWMWDCLTDLSFWGFIETVIRMIFKRPPKRYWEI